MFIQKAMVFNMVAVASLQPSSMCHAKLWVAAYVFLLRVPSEALPMMRGPCHLLRRSGSCVIVHICLTCGRRPGYCGPVSAVAPR